MHSYETLAILVLALSTASPAFSAPVRQQQARANVDERGIGSIAKNVGISAALGAVPVFLENLFGGNSTRRDTDLTPAVLRVDGLPVPISNNGDSNTPPTTPSQIFVDGRPVSLNQRAPGIGSVVSDVLDKFGTSDSFGKVLGEGVLGGLATGAATLGVSDLLNQTRRDVPDEISSVVPPPPTPTKVFDGPLALKGLPIVYNPPAENYTTNFLIPVAERAPDSESSSDESPDTILNNIFASEFANHNLPGRTYRRDPSPLSLSSILNTIEGIFGLGSSSSGSGGSLLSRDDALELARDLMDDYNKLKELEEQVTSISL